MHRFFLEPSAIGTEKVSFSPEISHQIKRVLRLKEGTEVEVLDNQGNAFQVRLSVMGEESVQGNILARVRPQSEPAVKIRLCVSLTQREKFEWILQKAVEVGAASIQPFVSRYSLTREKKIEEKRRLRWEDILREAAEQSGRIYIPTLLGVKPLAQVIEACSQEEDLCLAAWVGERTRDLKTVLKANSTKEKGLTHIAIFIGPEGGFDPAEIMLFEQAGIARVSLGKRVLRMETAAILAPALILYELGQMDI